MFINHINKNQVGSLLRKGSSASLAALKASSIFLKLLKSPTLFQKNNLPYKYIYIYNLYTNFKLSLRFIPS